MLTPEELDKELQRIYAEADLPEVTKEEWQKHLEEKAQQALTQPIWYKFEKDIDHILKFKLPADFKLVMTKSDFEKLSMENPRLVEMLGKTNFVYRRVNIEIEAQ